MHGKLVWLQSNNNQKHAEITAAKTAVAACLSISDKSCHSSIGQIAILS